MNLFFKIRLLQLYIRYIGYIQHTCIEYIHLLYWFCVGILFCLLLA